MWILFGRRWVRLPINVYVIDHADGVVLFDTGQDRAVVTDPDDWLDRITAFVSRHIFRHISIGPGDTLPVGSMFVLPAHDPQAAQKLGRTSQAHA